MYSAYCTLQEKRDLLSKIKWVIFFIFLLSSNNIFPQTQLIETTNSVYVFLKRMHVSSNLDTYDDVVLPFSRKRIADYLTVLENKKKFLKPSDQKLLDKYLLQFPTLEKVSFLSSLINETNFIPPKMLFGQKENHLYVYQDSLIIFQLDGILSLRNYLANNYHNLNGSSSILSYGGSFNLNYKDWLGIHGASWNGPQYGDREIAKIDQQTAQSFSFNSTKIRYVDGTKGYISFQNDLGSLVFGRERILWGTGAVHKIGLDKTPQLFDFIKLNLSYKKFQYDFLHGWLVEKPYRILVDSIGGTKNEKISKYIAINRIGFSPTENLTFGVTQTVIYSNRPMEAAYLNPFLLWESAQRSMNDLDNSFLTLDFRYRATDGILVNSSLLMDDLNFNNLFNGKWSTRSNGTAIQIGAELIPSLISEKLFLQFDYLQIRPFTFSHPSVQSSLSYTNNGFLLGPNYQPNSAIFTTRLSYYFNEDITAQIKYEYYLHGENILNSIGETIDNVGGDVFTPANFYTPYERYFLAGNLTKVNELQIILNWEPVYSTVLELQGNYQISTRDNLKKKSLFFALIFSYNFRSLN